VRSEAEALFRSHFAAEPEWSGEAPGRVNLIGEHVDYMGGRVLPAAIDRRLALAGAPSDRWEVHSSTPGGEAYLQALAAELGRGAQRVAIVADLPAGAGLSSSAALLVAAAQGWLGPDAPGVEAARRCRLAEQRATGVMVGAMDHLACALGRHGQVLLLNLADADHPHIQHLPFPPGLAIALIDSGVQRRLADTPYNQRREEALRGEPRRLRHVNSENRRVDEFALALAGGDRLQLGRLLLESHASLRDDYEVSLPAIDRLVERAARLPGCLGARLMGAGFGGSVLALVEAGFEAGFVAGMEAPVMVCQTADGAFV
jgi:galactokinase